MKCRICGRNTTRVQVVQNYPLCAGPVAKIGQQYPLATLAIGYCSFCGMCSTGNINQLAITYDRVYTSSNIAADGKAQAFLEFVKADEGDRILEIGCYDGSFMQMLEQRYRCIAEGCDPCSWAVVAAKSEGLTVTEASFTRELYLDRCFDMVVLRNVLEHIDHPLPFLSNVNDVLEQDGRLVLVVPDGEKRIREGILGSIVPEHPLYFGEQSLTNMLRICGFTDVETVKLPGLIMVSSTTGIPQTPRPYDSYLSDKLQAKLLSGAEISAGRSARVAEAVKGRRVVLYGANTCAIELLANKAIDPRQVVCAIDDDPYRWGKTLVNTGIRIDSRNVVPTLDTDALFVVCSYYSQEPIMKYLLATVKPPASVLKLYPEVSTVEVYKCR